MMRLEAVVVTIEVMMVVVVLMYGTKKEEFQSLKSLGI